MTGSADEQGFLRKVYATVMFLGKRRFARATRRGVQRPRLGIQGVLR